MYFLATLPLPTTPTRMGPLPDSRTRFDGAVSTTTNRPSITVVLWTKPHHQTHVILKAKPKNLVRLGILLR
jgi:hypothetical protein